MRVPLGLRLAPSVVLAACGGGGGKAPPPDGGAVAVAITPQPTDVLTCSTVPFTATVTGTSDAQVTWSVASGQGTIDPSGTYTAPDVTPASPAVTVSATSHADPSVSATTTPFTLGTAFPNSPISIGGSNGTAADHPSIYQHAIASNGSRVYAVWAVGPMGQTNVEAMLARSDDGGATWNTPVAAIATTITDASSGNNLDCAAVAVDPANPDVVYAIAVVNGKNALGETVETDENGALVLAASTDGGQTFQTHVLATDDAYDCADLVAPAPDEVVVEAPGDGCASNAANPPADMYVFSDASRGAGFAAGSGSGPYLATEQTDGLYLLQGPANCSSDLTFDSNGGDNGSGQAIESPRMFTDGAGRLCITYVAAATATTGNVYVQCSDDAGATFSAPVALAPALATHQFNQPIGALGPNEQAAVAWTVDATDLYIATSSDAGATFGAPVAVRPSRRGSTPRRSATTRRACCGSRTASPTPSTASPSTRAATAARRGAARSSRTRRTRTTCCSSRSR